MLKKNPNLNFREIILIEIEIMMITIGEEEVIVKSIDKIEIEEIGVIEIVVIEEEIKEDMMMMKVEAEEATRMMIEVVIEAIEIEKIIKGVIEIEEVGVEIEKEIEDEEVQTRKEEVQAEKEDKGLKEMIETTEVTMTHNLVHDSKVTSPEKLESNANYAK